MKPSVLMVKRDSVIDLLHSYIAGPKGKEWEECCRHIIDSVGKLPYWPASNPEERDDRNLMGQTEEEFWDLVD